MGLEAFRNKSASMLARIKDATEKANDQNESEFYFPIRDDNKCASVVIRFLPQSDPEKQPFVMKYSHTFKGDDNRWFFDELCGTTIGEDCPICQKNKDLWNTQLENNQRIARERKRKKEYICNILVLKDPKSPEKEGKVFPFKFGPSIYKKVMDAINPSFEDDTPLNPFDLWEGANFNFRVEVDKTKNFVSYDSSKFSNQSALYGGDEEKISAVIEHLNDIDSYIDKKLVSTGEQFVERVNNAYSVCLGTTKKDPILEQAEREKPVNETLPPWSSVPETPSTDDDTIMEFKKLIGTV